jgi:hypothetical protein
MLLSRACGRVSVREADVFVIQSGMGNIGVCCFASFSLPLASPRFRFFSALALPSIPPLSSSPHIPPPLSPFSFHHLPFPLFRRQLFLSPPLLRLSRFK